MSFVVHDDRDARDTAAYMRAPGETWHSPGRDRWEWPAWPWTLITRVRWPHLASNWTSLTAGVRARPTIDSADRPRRILSLHHSCARPGRRGERLSGPQCKWRPFDEKDYRRHTTTWSSHSAAVLSAPYSVGPTAIKMPPVDVRMCISGHCACMPLVNDKTCTI